MDKAVEDKQALHFPTIDPGVRIGHVHLKVADLQRALDFYCGVLGFELTTSFPEAPVGAKSVNSYVYLDLSGQAGHERTVEVSPS